MARQMIRVTIPGRFPSLNEYTAANRSDYRLGAKMKRQETERVAWAAKGKGKIKGPYKVRVVWYEKDRRRDVDNVEFAIKYILDGLVLAGVVEGDSQRFVNHIEHCVEVDPKNPRIVVDVIKENPIN